MKNPYKSVERVNTKVIHTLSENEQIHFVGVKEGSHIPQHFLNHLEATKNYVVHTYDRAAMGGRAVDMRLTNPITGHPMTGSSSGTAMNVRLYINDVGIGTDGGGSILAPAMSLNLFGFICPLIEQDYLKQFGRCSTDNILFSPSIGFITRDFKTLIEVIQTTLTLPKVEQDPVVMDETSIVFPDLSDQRQVLINFLQEMLPKTDILVSLEGPVDVLGMGDTIFGHFDEITTASQKASGKGLIRVANMVQATALCIPACELGKAKVLICESKPEKISLLLAYVSQIEVIKDEVLERYFSNLDQYL